MADKIVRTRFAPSPTGFLHVGGLRTAAYAYALAKKNNGQFILRIEDTDQKREVPGAKEKIYQILTKFGLAWDEGPTVGGPHAPYIQSERVASGIYQQAAEKLLAQDHAFYCFCKPRSKEEVKEDQEKKNIQFRDPCRQLSKSETESKLAAGEKPAIRLKVPDGQTIRYTDYVLQKEIKWDSRFVDDAMLLKSDGFPTYHLAVIVDDADMKITHIIRAAEWQSSTPIHLLLYRYLEIEPPFIGHPTAILDPAGGKLSKRKGNVSVEQFIEEGYLPEALFNFVVLLGWAPKDNQELFTLEDFVNKFDPNGFQKSNPVFHTKKLIWFNGQYIRSKTDHQLLELLRPFITYQAHDELLLKIIPLIKERIQTLAQFTPLTYFFVDRPTPPPELFDGTNPTYLAAANEVLTRSLWDKASIETNLQAEVEAKQFHKGEFFMALRLAVAGQSVTPPLTESMLILGQEEVLARLEAAIALD